MQYITEYMSPAGRIFIAAEEVEITGLWFEGQRYFPDLSRGFEEKRLPVHDAAEKWLDTYFGGSDPGDVPPLRLRGTPFRMEIWEMLTRIPYGSTVTYGKLAKRYADAHSLAAMSAQAVGGAVGQNPISIIVPCHRVLGADGSLTGYAGGTDIKRLLLELEGIVCP